MGLDRSAEQISKQLELPHVEQKAVSAMRSLLAEYERLEDTPRFRQALMRTLQDPAVIAVVVPFLPDEIGRGSTVSRAISKKRLLFADPRISSATSLP